MISISVTEDNLNYFIVFLNNLVGSYELQISVPTLIHNFPLAQIKDKIKKS